MAGICTPRFFFGWIFGVICPPLGVWSGGGISRDIGISFLLTMCGWLPGTVHCWWLLCVMDDRRAEYTKGQIDIENPPPHRGIWSQRVLRGGTRHSLQELEIGIPLTPVAPAPRDGNNQAPGNNQASGANQPSGHGHTQPSGANKPYGHGGHFQPPYGHGGHGTPSSTGAILEEASPRPSTTGATGAPASTRSRRLSSATAKSAEKKSTGTDSPVKSSNLATEVPQTPGNTPLVGNSENTLVDRSNSTVPDYPSSRGHVPTDTAQPTEAQAQQPQPAPGTPPPGTAYSPSRSPPPGPAPGSLPPPPPAF